MKKFYSLLAAALLVSGIANAQSQRLCLLEEFTQASCPPCASLNPALNALLDQNNVKVVSIKYQTNWPGTDPMNTQTQTWVGPRVSYYGVSGVPNICFDGNVITAASPTQLTQAGINSRYAVPSPFDLTVTHAYNATFDSISISVEAVASQAVSGSLVLHTVLVEKEVAFCTPPGSNGETEFYGVMRQMLPNASGSVLPASWTAGQSENFQFNIPVPSYIYDKKEMAVIVFIQNNTTKEVNQSAISNPLTLPLDASIKVCGLTTVTCDSAYVPSINVTNYGSDDLTALDINYSIGGNSGTYNWTGTLSSGSSTTVTLPAVTLSTANNTLSCSLASVNGGTDLVAVNNTLSASVIFNGSTPASTPVAQGFVSAMFPPASWIRLNGGVTTATWSRTAVGATANNGSAKMDFYNSPNGNVDELYTTKIDLSTISNPYLSFTMAKAAYTGYSDQLDINVSTDCGATWTTIWSQSDPQLTTAGNLTSAFAPTSGNASQWRTENVSLSAYIGEPEVVISFKAISGFGNNLYIDDINIYNSVAGVNENDLSSKVNLYPVPSSGSVFIDLSVFKNDEVSINILDVTGKSISNYSAARSNRHEILLQNLANGSYMVQVDADGERVIKPMILNR